MKRERERRLFLSSIYVYPIKSLKGIALTEARVEERGLQHDRRWMLVDENYTFLSQRTHPRLAIISVGLEAAGLKEWWPKRLVILEFPSVERAKDWWGAPEYERPKALRQASTRTQMVIVEGL